MEMAVGCDGMQTRNPKSRLREEAEQRAAAAAGSGASTEAGAVSAQTERAGAPDAL